MQATHGKPTPLSIKRRSGRGKDLRYKDVIKHPECYAPMCRKHNLMYDKFTAELREAVIEAKSTQEEIPF